MNTPALLRRILATVAIASSAGLTSCALNNDVVKERQDRRTDRYTNRLDRRETRTDARDERYDAWYDKVMH